MEASLSFPTSWGCFKRRGSCSAALLGPGRRKLPLTSSFLCGCSALMESLINPLQERIEDWKKTANQLDKDHAKGRAALWSQGLGPRREGGWQGVWGPVMTGNGRKLWPSGLAFCPWESLSLATEGRGQPRQELHGGLFPASSEYKRARHEIKKKSSDTLKLQKKARKGEDLRIWKEHWVALRK